MHTQFHYMIALAQARSAALRRDGEQARLANDAPWRRRNLRDWASITRRPMHSERVRSHDITALELETATRGAR